MMQLLLVNACVLLLLRCPTYVNGNDQPARGRLTRDRNDSIPVLTTGPIPASLPPVKTPSNETTQHPPATLSNITTGNGNNTLTAPPNNNSSNNFVILNVDANKTNNSAIIPSTSPTANLTNKNHNNTAHTITEAKNATTDNATTTNTGTTGNENSTKDSETNVTNAITANNASKINTRAGANITHNITAVASSAPITHLKLTGDSPSNSSATINDTDTDDINDNISMYTNQTEDAVTQTNYSTSAKAAIGAIVDPNFRPAISIHLVSADKSSSSNDTNPSNITTAETDYSAFFDDDNNNDTTANDTVSSDADFSNITAVMASGQWEECDNETVETNATSECFSRIDEDDLKKELKAEIFRSDVYKRYKVTYPCVKGHLRKTTLLITTLIVKLSPVHPLKMIGDQLAVRVFPKDDKCELLVRRATCIKPEWDWMQGRDASAKAKTLGEFIEKLEEVKGTGDHKSCDDAFKKLAFLLTMQL